MKKTLEKEIASRKAQIPNTFLYKFLYHVVIKLLYKNLHTTFTFKARPQDEEGPIFLISNHASRNDYLFTVPAVYPKKLNFVVGYNEFYRFPVSFLLKILKVIPKRNFVPDVNTILKIKRIVRMGGSICMMPEGMSSITGMAQPVIPGGAELLKSLGIPVYYTKISGAYLTYTKHCLDERVGRVDVVVDRMFTKEELETLSCTEIEDRMNCLLAHDDYIWNAREQVHFNGKNQMAKQLDTLLYRCPKCNSIYQMKCSGNTMTCTACGNQIEMDDTYQIHAVGEGSICPTYVTDWTIWEREIAHEEVQKEDFSFSEEVQVGVLPEYKHLTGDATSIICGKGILTLQKDGLHFEGTLKDQPYTFFIPSKNLPTYGMCTDISRFYTFIDSKFIEFYPKNNDVLYWDHLTEELHRVNDGEWKNTSYRQHE